MYSTTMDIIVRFSASLVNARVPAEIAIGAEARLDTRWSMKSLQHGGRSIAIEQHLRTWSGEQQASSVTISASLDVCIHTR